MERNFVLAIVLSVVIIIVFQYFFQSFSPPPPKRPPVTTESPRDGQVPQPAKVEQPPPAPVQPKDDTRLSAVPPTPAKPIDQGAEAPIKDMTIKIDTPKYEAILSSVGGKIVSFKLKEYLQKHDGIELVNLFPQDVPDTSGPSLELTGREETIEDSALRYHCDAQEPVITLAPTATKRSISFTASTAAGLKIVKTFTFEPERYVVGFSFTVTNTSREARNYLVSFPWKKYFKVDPSERFSWNSVEILLNGELKDYAFTDIKDEQPSGKVEWAGLGDVYFFKALVPITQPAQQVTLFKPQEGVARIMVRYGGVDLPPDKPVQTEMSIYLGPKERQALEVAGQNLSRALFYSKYWILEVCSEFLMKFLRFCNSGFEVAGLRIPGTHNFGWDIILLTIVIKILFIPLTHKSMKSMKKMQTLQPEIDKLKEKFKDNKTEQNQALMQLFKEHKVHPLGGRWPMLLQLPVFIALYQALSYAIELRHAPFLCYPSIYLCINDLSSPDPYYVTPILMGGTMVLQQWMTPSAGDPMQKKMMLLMPVFFTYLFLSFPSGLVLYWLVSNVLSIGQQLLTNKMSR